MQRNALFYKNALEKCIELKKIIDLLFQKKEFIEIKRILQENKDEIIVDNDLSLLYYLVKVYETEISNQIEFSIFSTKKDINEAIDIFTALKFKLRRIEFNMPDALSEFYIFVISNHLSIYVIQLAAQFGCMNTDLVFNKIKEGVR